MSSSRLILAPVTQTEGWDALVGRSPQGTIFSELFYLEAARASYHLYYILQGTALKAGVVLTTSADGSTCELNDLVIYGGILFDLNPARPEVKRRHDEFQITEFFAREIAAAYQSLQFQLSPEFLDLRPLLWHRYHDVEGPKYQTDLRYTCYLDVTSLREHSGREESSRCFQELESVRRYSIREASRKGGGVARGGNPGALVRGYRSLMCRQGQIPSDQKLANIQNIMDALIFAGRGEIFHALDEDGTVLYSAFYGWDNKRAYYLFGAGNPDRSESWPGTLVHWEAFKYLAQVKCVSEVDLEGVNSPQRGWFKLSFGGNLRPYFRVAYRKGLD